MIDLDGTLCTGDDPDYRECHPVVPVIKKVNELYDAGWHIAIYTARGMGRFDGNVDSCYTEFYCQTRSWLQENGVKFHELRLGKPSATYYVDDKGLNVLEFLTRDFRD